MNINPAQDPVELSAEEISEVDRHKYFLSEKAGYDVGWDFALQDWMSHHRSSEGAGEKPSQAPAGVFGSVFRRLFSKAAL